MAQSHCLGQSTINRLLQESEKWEPNIARQIKLCRNQSTTQEAQQKVNKNCKSLQKKHQLGQVRIGRSAGARDEDQSFVETVEDGLRREVVMQATANQWNKELPMLDRQTQPLFRLVGDNCKKRVVAERLLWKRRGGKGIKRNAGKSKRKPQAV